MLFIFLTQFLPVPPPHPFSPLIQKFPLKDILHNKNPPVPSTSIQNIPSTSASAGHWHCLENPVSPVSLKTSLLFFCHLHILSIQAIMLADFRHLLSHYPVRTPTAVRLATQSQHTLPYLIGGTYQPLSNSPSFSEYLDA